MFVASVTIPAEATAALTILASMAATVTTLAAAVRLQQAAATPQISIAILLASPYAVVLASDAS